MVKKTSLSSMGAPVVAVGRMAPPTLPLQGAPAHHLAPSTVRITRAATTAKRHTPARKRPAIHFRAPISTVLRVARIRRAPNGGSARWSRGTSQRPTPEGAST